MFTQEQFEQLKEKAFKYAEANYPTLRKGQAIYNYFYHRLEHLEPVVFTLSNKEVDCFYRDDKINIFLETLKEEIVNTNNYE